MDEDIKIMKEAFKNSGKPENFERFKQMLSQKKRIFSWTYLGNFLSRERNAVKNRWASFICPTLLAHLYGALGKPWKKDFFKFVIESKAISVSEIDWKEVEKRWPYLFRPNVVTVIGKFVSNKANYGFALWETLEKHTPYYEEKEPNPKRKLALIDAFKELEIPMQT